MRIYFLSYVPAVLKLNGIYVGGIDGFERHIDVDLSDRIFAEILPAENLQPANFFIDEDFIKKPPEFADVYFDGSDAFIYIRNYAVKDIKLKVIFQRRFCGNLITVFSQGGVYLAAEGAVCELTPLPTCFKELESEENAIAGKDVLALKSGNRLVLISESGKIIFSNPVEKYAFGDNFTVTAAFETCLACKAECVYSYDGENLKLISSRTYETEPPDDSVLHFAFFESVLTCGDYASYLHSDIKDRADDIKGYLGDFVSVTVPTEKFYTLHPGERAAGLVYPKGENLFEIKYFAAEIKDKKISNIYPVE